MYLEILRPQEILVPLKKKKKSLLTLFIPVNEQCIPYIWCCVSLAVLRNNQTCVALSEVTMYIFNPCSLSVCYFC